MPQTDLRLLTCEFHMGDQVATYHPPEIWRG